jgi:hypothetical protein
VDLVAVEAQPRGIQLHPAQVYDEPTVRHHVGCRIGSSCRRMVTTPEARRVPVQVRDMKSAITGVCPWSSAESGRLSGPPAPVAG